MPKFEANINILEFNRGGWTQAFETMFHREFKKALRAFLEAAEPRVPVETGMARGSLKPLAALADYDLTINPTRVAKGKGPSEGDQAAVLKMDDFAFPNYGFTFKSNVLHYMLHEKYDKLFNEQAMKYVHQAAWRSMQHGRTAFKKYLREHLKDKIPKISDYIVKTRARGGR